MVQNYATIVKGAIREELKMLAICATEVVDEENLSKPTEIKFINNVKGNKRYQAMCIQSNATGRYRINICLRKANFERDPRGKLVNKKGERFVRTAGAIISYKQTIHNMAHELAHIRFWEHNPEHTSYTKHLEERLILKLKEHNITPDCEPFK